MNPWFARNVLLRLQERLMGRRTFKEYRQVRRLQWLDAERIRELQLAKLRELVATALNRTDGYAELADVDRSWLPKDLDDLARLPLLDKATISAHRERLVNRSVGGGAIRYNTGGSSGEPLIFYFDKRRQACDKAARMLAHQWWSVKPGDREAYLWGSPVELNRQDRLKNLRDRLTNEMLLPAFDLSRKSVRPFYKRLLSFRPKCLFGYPSSIALFCRLAMEDRLDLTAIGLQVVFSTAEVLYDHQKELISESFGNVPVVNGYGSREGGFISHECPAGGMHVLTPHLIVEFILDGRHVRPGEDGEIVVTHLDNLAMPFIRYRTGDVGQPGDGPCPCGRGLATMKVLKGRSTDFVIAPDGRWVHGLALIYVVRAVPGVREYQIVQDDVDSIDVRFVDDGEQFPADGERTIADGIARRMGGNVRVTVSRVKRIQRDPSGKFRYVVSQPARQRLAAMDLSAEQGPETPGDCGT